MYVDFNRIMSLNDYLLDITYASLTLTSPITIAENDTYSCFRFVHISKGLSRVKRASEYDQEIPRSHTEDQPTTPLGRATEH